MWRYFLSLSLFLGQLCAGSPDDIVIPRKTDLFVSLERALDSRTASVGDRFHARLSVPVTANDQIVIPVGSFIIGEVDYKKQPGYLKGTGQLKMSFDTVIFPDGRTRKMVAVVQSAEGHSSGRAMDEGKVIAEDRQGEEIVQGTTAGVAVGGVTGAIAGRDLRGFGVGAAVGAATGAILGAFRKGKHVELPRGSALTIQLEQDIRLVQPDAVPPRQPLKPD